VESLYGGKGKDRKRQRKKQTNGAHEKREKKRKKQRPLSSIKGKKKGEAGLVNPAGALKSDYSPLLLVRQTNEKGGGVHPNDGMEKMTGYV